MFTKLYSFIKKSQERKTAYWQLNNMTDKELRDIGISRSQIEDILRG